MPNHWLAIEPVIRHRRAAVDEAHCFGFSQSYGMCSCELILLIVPMIIIMLTVGLLVQPRAEYSG